MLWVSITASLIPPVPAAEDAGEGAAVGTRLSSLLSFLTSFSHLLPSPASPSSMLHLPGPAYRLHPTPSLKACTFNLEPLPGRTATWAMPLPAANPLPKSQRLGTP